MKILISFLIVLFINNSILANNYSQCILDNMKDITSDSAANAIREACWALYPKEKKKVTKEKCERVPYSNSKWSFDEISTKYVPKPEWGALIGGSFQQNCKSIGDQFWMAGFLASCSQYGNKVYYLTFTNEGDKEALAFFQYKKKNGSYIVHQWGKKVPPYNSSVFEIQEIDFKIPDWDYYNFEVYYNKCEMIEE